MVLSSSFNQIQRLYYHTMNIEYIGRDAIVETPKVSFTYQVSETPRDFYKLKSSDDYLDWNERYNYIGDYIVYPYGSCNDLPDIIKKVVQENYLAPGVLKKKTQLLWGLGPMLYTEKMETTGLVREWTEDDVVMKWLESWDYQSYLLKACVDFQHIEGVFSKIELSKGARLGKNFISRLIHLYPDRTRLSSLKEVDDREATHAIVTDWSFSTANSLTKYKVYNLFDFTKPFENKNAVIYSNMYSFCTDYYTVPDLYGSLEWLRRSTAVPLIFKALSKNSINLKYHIVSPQAFWDKKKEAIVENCVKRNIEFKESMIEEYQTEFLKKVSEVLSGEENTGRYLHTTKSFTVDGTNLIEHGWEINVIDQKIKDFVDSQIAISNRADHAISGGIGLHSALGNVSESGKSDSGSEQLYALKNYLLTGIDIPEMIVMKAINYAIKANWPEKKVKLGFYHMAPEKEQDVTESKRVKNIV